MSDAPASAITLRALDGEPLRDPAIRDMVVATAHAIAERQGVEVAGIETAPDRITVAVAEGRIAALGLAAELRRLTTDWYTRKYGAQTLWGEDPGEEDDGGNTGETWKRA